jgi:hypothetical protein
VLTSPMIAVKGVNDRGVMSYRIAALDSLGTSDALRPAPPGAAYGFRHLRETSSRRTKEGLPELRDLSQRLPN